MSEDRRRRVALVGATGVAGQQFLVSLADHPWFELTTLAASTRSAGKKYTDAITTPGGAAQWGCEEALPQQFADMTVVNAADLDLSKVDLVFSAVESDAARTLEASFAPEVPVVSTASGFMLSSSTMLLPNRSVIRISQSLETHTDARPAPDSLTGLTFAVARPESVYEVMNVVVPGS